jgi:hypothetical protein
MPGHLPEEARSLLKALLCPDPASRLGALGEGLEVRRSNQREAAVSKRKSGREAAVKAAMRNSSNKRQRWAVMQME